MMSNDTNTQFEYGACDKWQALIWSAILMIHLSVNAFAAEESDIDGSDAVLKNVETTKFGDILVTGGNPQVRGVIASSANDLRVQLNKLCADPDRKMKLPIIIKLHGAEGDEELSRSIVGKIRSMQGQYQLLLHIHLAKGVDQYFLLYHLMEMLLYERGLASNPLVEDGDRLTIKPWLTIGMLEAIDVRRADSNRRIYQSDIDFLSVMSLEKVFNATESQWRELIGHESIAFRAISGAIVNSLLRQPGGKSAMLAYLTDFATFKGEYENLLRQHFAGMNKSSSSLGKWVNLELLELATARVTQVHSILETESRLDSILKLYYRDADGAAVSVGIDAYQAILELGQKDRLEAVAAARAELERLSYRCFPTYRPMLAEYELILREFARGSANNIDTRLARLMDVRMRMQAAAIRSRDYLDWYYITQSRDLTGDFGKYRALNEALKKEQLRHRTNDAVSNYLDEIQRIYGSNY
jgi:hypothetical protein